MRFGDFQTHDRRLVLLRALESAAQYKANAYLLRRYCEAVGHVVSTDQVATDLAWLEEQSLVGLAVEHDITVATLTARGLDVANGAAHVPGVARPAPGA